MYCINSITYIKIDILSNFYFFYAGRNLLSEFEKRKIITGNSPDDLCSGVVTYEGKRTGWTAYTKEDRKVANKNNRYEILGQSIFDVVRLCYESELNYRY